MFNKKNYGYVTVEMDKRDYAINNLEEDLVNWEHRLGKVEKKDKILYKGLLPKDGIKNLELLTCVSPYGAGYTITINDGLDINDWLRIVERP